MDTRTSSKKRIQQIKDRLDFRDEVDTFAEENVSIREIPYDAVEDAMSILEELQDLDSHIPDDAVTVRDVMRMKGWSQRKAQNWLYEGFLEGRFDRDRKADSTGMGHPYYYWTKEE